MYTGTSVRTHDNTEKVRCKGPFLTKVKKFYPVYKSRIVKSREKAGTGAGVRSYRRGNLMQEKAFAESRKGVKKIPRLSRRILAVHGHPCGRPPKERNGPGLFRVSQRPWKVKAAGRFFQRRVKAGRAPHRRGTRRCERRPPKGSLEAACTMGERRPDPRKQWDERGRRGAPGAGAPWPEAWRTPEPPAGAAGRGGAGESLPVSTEAVPPGRATVALRRERSRARAQREALAARKGTRPHPRAMVLERLPERMGGGRKNRAADTAGCV